MESGTLTSPPRRLDGMAAIVTGGASGIGRATTLALAAAGSNVFVVDVNAGRIAETVADVSAVSGGSASGAGLPLDVRSEEDMAQMARETVERFGRIDILVTCAAILRAPGTPPKPVIETGVEEFDAVIDTNLKGVFLSNRAVLPQMFAQRSGNILNVSSTSGRQGLPHDGPYCASKFGVIGLSESLAAEARNFGVRVQVVLPDATDTPLWEQNKPVPKPRDSMPPERIAETILFLVTLPEDTTIIAPVVAPFRARRRAGKGDAKPADAAAKV